MTSTVAVQRAVLKSDLPAPARHVMLTLAAIADFKTGAIPAEHSRSLSELADATGLGRSTTARILNLLEASGWVKRDRPEVTAARTEGAKTAYALKIGGSPAAGLGVVPERDQVDAKGSPAPGPGLVPLRDGGSPAAGRIRGTDLKVCTDPPSSTSHSQPAAQRAKANSKRVDKHRRGTRIPDDFAVTADMVAWARANAPHVDGRRETEMFINYWRSKTGRDATKLDWVLTWRNWLLKEEKTSQRSRARASPPVTTRHIDDLTPEQRAARNPLAGSIRASQVRGAS
jgi:hypothetical protein